MCVCVAQVRSSVIPEIVDVEFFSRLHCITLACPPNRSGGGCRKVMKPPPPAAGANVSLAEALPALVARAGK
eukprot:SAG22_NODE_5393_length_1022_cov_1.699892_1_plen_71_part_10